MKGKKLLIFTLLIAFMFQIFVPSGNVKAAGTDISNTFPLITTVNITDPNGAALGNNIAKDSQIHVNYTWSIPNATNINDGDFYTMQLPNEISIVSAINQPLLDANDNSSVVANMHVDTSGKVTITFTSYASTHSDVHGGFSIGCQFNKNNIGNINPIPVTFQFPAQADITAGPFNFMQPDPTISKGGHYDAATDEITWTVTFNHEGVKLTNATLEDTMGNGQDFIDGSVKVNDSNPSDAGASYTYDSSSKKLVLTLGDITTQQVITYKTSIHSDLSTKPQGNYTYTNTAVVKYSDNSTPKSITSTASVPVNVQYISKTGGYDAPTKSITWTITVNQIGRTINNATVTDTLPNGLRLTSSSTHCSTSGQTVTFNLGDITSQQTITYSTSVDTNIYNSNGSTNYTNTATLSGDGVPSNTSSTYTVGVGSNIIEKDGADYNASTGIITWKIIVNKNNISVPAGALVTDNIPVGQTYVPNSAVLDYGTGNATAISDDTSYTTADTSDTSKTGTFTYTFADAFSDTHTITFKTQVTDPKVYRANYVGNYSNNVNITASGINQTTSGTQPVNSQIISKTPTGYDYNARVISWRIVVNRNKMPINNAVITDDIPTGQEYVAGSAAINNSADPNGFNYKDISNDASKTGTLTYNFSNAINDMYTITFKTRVSDLSIFNTTGNKYLSNSATITGDGIPNDGGRQSTGTQTIYNTIVSKAKNYVSGNSYIDWTVNVNPNYNLSMGGTTITDNLQSGLSLNTDTVELDKAVVNANGSLSAGVKIALTADNVKYDPSTRKFIFTFPQDAGTSAYILKFTTDVARSGNYTNSVTFNGSGLIQSPSITSFYVGISSGSGWGVGTTGSITVEKVDSNDNTKTLSGAVFQLIDQYGNVKATSSPTGNDGKALFSTLKFDTNYSIREITPPAGYNLSSEVYNFQVHSATNLKNIVYNYKDIKIKKDITFRKLGQGGNPLQGATFTLYKSDGVTPVLDAEGANVTATSDVNGTVTFSSIEYGNYKIKETSAPTGYLIASDVITASFSGDYSNATVTVTPNSISDTKIIGGIKITKTDASTSNPVPGATIEVFTSDGNQVGNGTTGITGADGTVEFDNLPYGNYYFMETNAPEGYLLNSDMHPFSITDNGVIVKSTISDTKITGGIKITKVDTSIPSFVAGTTIGFFNSDGTQFGSATKQADGFDGTIQFNKLAYGNFYFAETSVPNGYLINTDRHPFSINRGDNFIPLLVPGLTVTVYSSNGTAMGTITKKATGFDGTVKFDNLAYGNYYYVETDGPTGYQLNTARHPFSVNKTDMSASSPVPGATITVFKSDGTQVGNGTTGITGADGTVEFDNLPYGDYYFMETNAPQGYSINTDEHPFSITSNGVILNATISDTKLSPGTDVTRITGGIKITKTDASTSLPVPGATIEVFTGDGNQVGTGTEGVTGVDGTVEFDNLPYGSYYFLETRAPKGYLLNTDRHPFSITDNGVIVIDTISDTKITGGIKITKFDNSIPTFLPGTTIGFFTSGGTQFGSATKNADGFDGNIQLNKLSYGNYYFSETSAPAGYLLNTDKHFFSLSRGDNFIPLLVPGLTITIYSSNGTKMGTVTKNATGFDVTAEFNNLAYGNYYYVETGGPTGYQLNTARHPFSVNKTDISSSSPVSGATIEVFKSDGTPVGTGTKGTTGADGTVEFDNLPYGNYYFMETNAPEGYSINTDRHPFSITDNGVIITDNISDAKLNPGTDITNITGGIKITKTDASTSAPVPGATIEVFKSDGTQVGTGTEGVTSSNGTVEFDNLPYGSYYFLETRAPEGYLLNNDRHPFSITNNGTIIADTISDTKITGGIKITKIDSFTSAPLSGATIEIFNSNGTKVGNGTEGITGTNGTVEFDNLPYGSYYFLETRAPEGYLLNNDKHPFSITDNGTIIPDTISDTKITSGIKITKTDASTSAPVPGATIEVFNSNGTQVGSGTEGVTGADGTVEFDNLPYGSYYFLETRAPEGYLLNNDRHPFSIINNGTIITDTISDTKITGGIKITKTDASTSAPLYGATIEIFNSDGTKVGNGTDGITCSDGTVEFDNLPYGNYYFIETNAPEGYSLNTDRHPFSITDNGTIVTATISDAKITGGIKITKTDVSTSAPVPGATIKVFKSDGTAVGTGTEGVTGANGTVEFDNLPYGNYYFLETNAPEGYLLNNDRHPFSITDNGTIITATISDTKITGGIKITKTDASTSAPVPGATIEIFKSDGTVVGTGTEGVTDADGTVQFDNLPYGSYYFLETRAPKGYSLNTDRHPFSITDNGTIVTDTISDTKITGGIKITKTDASTSAPVPGATIEIFKSDGTLVGNKTEGVTGADGTVEFDNLSYGNYYFLETRAPEGYSLNTDRHPFSIVDNGVIITDTISDTKIIPIPTPIITGGIKISKIDAATSKPIPGATITVFSSDGKKTEGVTGTDGTVEFDNLPAGNYYFLETKAPEGYLLNTDRHPFSIVASGVILRDTISDTKIAGGIKITKTDAATSKPIPGATITVFSSDGKKTEGVTGADGTVEFDNLPTGNYYFLETKAPEGYSLNTDRHPFSIVDNGVILKDTISDTKIVPIPTKITGGIKITKTDAATSKPIPGATITVFSSDGKEVEGITGTDGTVQFNNLPAGNYYFLETKAPEGYSLNTEKHPFSIVNDGVILKDTISDTKIVPIPTQGTGGIKISQIDSSNSKPIPGATITIFTSKGKQIGSAKVIGPDGTVEFDNLPYGDYYFVESKGPEGYSIDTEKHPFSITANGVVIKNIISVSNSNASSVPRTDTASSVNENSNLPQTGGLLNTNLIILIGLITVLGGILILAINKKNSRNK